MSDSGDRDPTVPPPHGTRHVQDRPLPRVPGLRQMVVLADGHRGAVLAPDGGLVWLCVPSWDDDPVFSRLVGGSGDYSVTPLESYTAGGFYRPGTLIWEGRYVTHGATLQISAALALPADPHRVVVLRRLRAEGAPLPVRLRLEPRGAFGRHALRDLHRDGATWTGHTGPLQVRWQAPHGVRGGDDGLRLDLVLRPGEEIDLVLEVGDGPFPDLPRPEDLWRQTEEAWGSLTQPQGVRMGERDARMSAAVLRGLTNGSDGMVAAVTMGLPERADRNRNYDYRYSWIRDSCYAGVAAAAAGLPDVLDSAVGFVTAHVLEDGARLRPAYRVGGGPVPAERRIPLPGYPGGADVVGNWAGDQFQLDAWGDVLRLFASAAAQDRLDDDARSALALAVDVVESNWQRPDSGIWEIEPDWWSHSRLSAVAGLKQVAQQVAAGRAPGDSDRVQALAETMLAETTRRCLHPTGRWQRSPTLRQVDAALLWPAVCGAVDADDPRAVATLEAVLAELVDDGYVYRYLESGAAPGEAEGAFLLCGFMVAFALAQQGRMLDAVRWYERTRASCGSPGLFTEEYDVRQRELRGNLPQAFVHALLLQASVCLGSDAG